jgi:hypothetical protein
LVLLLANWSAVEALARRDDMSAEAMAAFLDMPDNYPVDAIAQALDQLRADGDYDRIVNEAVAPLSEQVGEER